MISNPTDIRSILSEMEVHSNKFVELFEVLFSNFSDELTSAIRKTFFPDGGEIGVAYTNIQPVNENNKFVMITGMVVHGDGAVDLSVDEIVSTGTRASIVIPIQLLENPSVDNIYEYLQSCSEEIHAGEEAILDWIEVESPEDVDDLLAKYVFPENKSIH